MNQKMKTHSIADDARVDPTVLAELAKTGSHVAAPEASPESYATMDQKLSILAATEPMLKANLNNCVLNLNLPTLTNVSCTKVVVLGVDSNEVVLYIHKPTDHLINGRGAPLPCVYHIHGGGMCLLEASDEYYVRWRSEIASLGVMVVGVEYRNAAGVRGCHRYPAGLNDCISGLKYLHSNKAALGISTIVLNGESGGGNLALATCLYAKKLDILSHISGVYAQCPFISNLYQLGAQVTELPSLQECNGYLLDGVFMNMMAEVYTPLAGATRCTDPLAWPYHAPADALTGLPPHTITVNELDPLKDEGVSYYRKLMKAGVRANCKVIMATTHAAEMAAARRGMSEVHRSAVYDVYQFARNITDAVL